LACSVKFAILSFWGYTMPKISPSLVQAAADIDPLNLAILVIGVVALAAVWLAAVAIKSALKKE
jgi:uncharacterized membrane protein